MGYKLSWSIILELWFTFNLLSHIKFTESLKNFFVQIFILKFYFWHVTFPISDLFGNGLIME